MKVVARHLPVALTHVLAMTILDLLTLDRDAKAIASELPDRLQHPVAARP